MHGRWADGSNGQPKSHLPYQLKLSKPPVCSVWIIYRSNDWAGTPFNYIGFVREHDSQRLWVLRARVDFTHQA